MPPEKTVVRGCIRFLLNGEPYDAPAGTTISEILDRLGLPADRVAVELNREIVRQGRRESTIIHADSSLEIVEFVGGG
jgi:sulfur carrier protein